MIADKLLDCLDGVKQTGPDRWLAHCPAHDDRTPSLSIREIDDRVLIKCWAGCSAYEIVSAVELSLSDLFPPGSHALTKRSKPIKKAWPAEDVLRALGSECTIVALVAHDMASGQGLQPDDVERLRLTVDRIQSAVGAAGVHYV